MKILLLAVIILVNVSSAHEIYTGIITDHLRDGFDAVYKVKVNSTAFLKKRSTVLFQSDLEIHFRKPSFGETERFVVHLNNVKLRGIDITDSQATLPLIYTIQNNKIQQVFGTENDNQESVNGKNAVVAGVFTNLTTKLTDGVIASDSCEIPITYKEKGDQLRVEVNIGHNHCFSKLLLQKYKIASWKNVKCHGGDYFDKATGQLLRSFIKIKSKIKGKITLSMATNVYFAGFKKIEEVFDETKNTKMFEANFESDVYKLT